MLSFHSKHACQIEVKGRAEIMYRLILRDGKVLTTTIKPPSENVLAITNDDREPIAYCFMTDEAEDNYLISVGAVWNEQYMWDNWKN